MELYNTKKYFNDFDLLSKRYRVGINLLSKEGLKEYFFNYRQVSEEEMEMINKYVTESKCSISSSPYDMYGFDGDYIDYLRLISDEKLHESLFDIDYSYFQNNKEDIEDIEDVELPF